MLDSMTRVGFVVVAALGASAALTVALVAAAGAPVWAGLALLGVLDVVIVACGYAVARRAGGP